MATPLSLILITADPRVAAHAWRGGVTYVMVDLEWRGKAERQAGWDLPLSRHSVVEVAALKDVLPPSALMVRINPWGEWSAEEIAQVSACRPALVMHPMTESVDQLRAVREILDPATQLIALLETRAGVAMLDDLEGWSGLVDMVYIGLNDLRLSFSWPTIFWPIVTGDLAAWSRRLQAGNVPFGWGGMGSLTGELNVPARLLLAEHVRLGSAAVILSRSFLEGCGDQNLGIAVAEIRKEERRLRQLDPDDLLACYEELTRIIVSESPREAPSVDADVSSRGLRK